MKDPIPRILKGLRKKLPTPSIFEAKGEVEGIRIHLMLFGSVHIFPVISIWVPHIERSRIRRRFLTMSAAVGYFYSLVERYNLKVTMRSYKADYFDKVWFPIENYLAPEDEI